MKPSNMARLAIRATGDNGRERVTASNDTIVIEVLHGNKHTYTIQVDAYGLQVYDESSVYMYAGEPTYETIHYIRNSEKKSEREDVRCPHGLWYGLPCDKCHSETQSA